MHKENDNDSSCLRASAGKMKATAEEETSTITADTGINGHRGQHKGECAPEDMEEQTIETK